MLKVQYGSRGASRTLLASTSRSTREGEGSSTSARSLEHARARVYVCSPRSSRVIHRRSDTTNIETVHGNLVGLFYILDVALQTLMLCTESCVQERFCGKVIPPKYKRPMLRNIGRFYRSTDGSNIPFRGEASYDLAISGERVTQVL